MNAIPEVSHPFCHGRTQGEGALCGPGGGTSPEQGHTGAFILGFPASRIGRKKCLLFRSYLVFVFCYRTQMGWDRKRTAFSCLPPGEPAGARWGQRAKWRQKENLGARLGMPSPQSLQHMSPMGTEQERQVLTEATHCGSLYDQRWNTPHEDSQRGWGGDAWKTAGIVQNTRRLQKVLR